MLQTKRTNPAIDQVFIDPKDVLAVEHSGNPGHTLILTDQGAVEVPVPLDDVIRTLGIRLVELPTRQGGMVHVAPSAVRDIHHDRIVMRDGLILDMAMAQRAVENALNWKQIGRFQGQNPADTVMDALRQEAYQLGASPQEFASNVTQAIEEGFGRTEAARAYIDYLRLQHELDEAGWRRHKQR
jgi:hypothetical protein